MPFEATPVVLCFDFLQLVLIDAGDINRLVQCSISTSLYEAQGVEIIE
jgi:hypothetical protein